MSKIAVIGIAGNSVFLPVEKFHEGGETVEASSAHMEPGGKGFNQAVAATRAGATVCFLAAVGRDGGAGMERFLKSEGIMPTLIQKDADSAFAAIITDRHGRNHVTVYHGASLSAEDVLSFSKEISEADLLLLNNEVDEAVNIKAIEIAKQYGVKVVLNPAPARENADYILQNVDLFTPNEHETQGLEDASNVIVTLGKRGCLIRSENRIIPAASVGQVIDTTGAGDTFNGVLAVCLAEGKTVAESAEYATVAAGISVTKKYVMNAIPFKNEIERVMLNE